MERHSLAFRAGDVGEASPSSDLYDGADEINDVSLATSSKKAFVGKPRVCHQLIT